MTREYYGRPSYEELVASQYSSVPFLCFQFPTEHLKNSQT